MNKFFIAFFVAMTAMTATTGAFAASLYCPNKALQCKVSVVNEVCTGRVTGTNDLVFVGGSAKGNFEIAGNGTSAKVTVDGGYGDNDQIRDLKCNRTTRDYTVKQGCTFNFGMDKKGKEWHNTKCPTTRGRPAGPSGF